MPTTPFEILDRVFETTHFCLVYLDRDLKFVRVNQAYADTCGHPPGFFAGKNHFELYPGEKAEAIFRQVVATGKPFTIEANPFEFPDQPERGVTYWDWTLHPLRGEGGSVEGLLLALLEVTARKRAEEALQASEQRYRFVLDNVDEVVYMVNMTESDPHGGAVEFVSNRVKGMLGYDPDEFLADPALWFKSLHPEDVPAIEEATRKMFSRKAVRAMAYRMRHRTTGEYRWIGDRLVPRVDPSGQVVGGFGVARDITEAKLAEQARHESWRRLLRLQDKERRRIARELHDTTAQNLAALSMNLVLLEQAAPPGDARFGRLLAECQQLADHSSQEIRSLSYLLHPPLLDDFGLVRAMRDYAEGYSQRSGIRVELEAPEDWCRLPEDIEMALFRVVQESLGNVHRHSGSPVARIRLARNDEQLSLEIRDEGRGLPADLVNIQGGLGAAAGVGLLGMRERIQHLGGSLELETGLPGALVRALLPIKDPV